MWSHNPESPYDSIPDVDGRLFPANGKLSSVEPSLTDTSPKRTIFLILWVSAFEEVPQYQHSDATNINHKGLQRTANEYAEERRIHKDLISKNNNVDILNSAGRIL